MTLAVLHTRLSGYLAACLHEFQVRTGAGLSVHAWPNQPDAPFDDSLFHDLGEIHNRRERSDREIESAVRAFRPDAILTSGWADTGYVKICRAMRNAGIPVIAGCDTQWTGSLRQQAAALTAGLHVRKAIDVLWVTGERQAMLGRALGYFGDRLWDGYYACDWTAFGGRGQGAGNGTQGTEDEDLALEAPVASISSSSLPADSCLLPPDPFFLYVGRYVPEKGLDTLAEAYRLYRAEVADPWKLVCAGAGPLRDTLLAAGAEDRGFVQPNDLPALMHQASAFVLPSRFEPWGVVAHEAAASGLPLILSDACGAGVHLLRDLHNGFGFPAGDARGLARAMVRMHGLDPARREGYGQASFELSKQYTPQRWAETLIAGLENLKRTNSR